MPKKYKNKINLDIDKIQKDISDSQYKQLVFKNYPDFCKYLNIPVLKGDSKISQLNKLKKLIHIEKQNDNSLIIKNILLPMFDLDKNNLKQLTEYTILSYLLYQHKDERNNCTVSISYLAEMLGYITLKYKYFYTHPKELSSKTDIPISTIYEFFEKTNDLYNRYITESLNILEKYKILSVSHKYFGVEYVISDKLHETINLTDFGDEEVQFTPEIQQECRELTNDEIQKLLIIERDAFFETINFSPNEDKEAFLNELKQNKISLMYFLFSHRLEKKYYSIRHKKLVEELNLSTAYKAYDIVYDYNSIFSTFQYTYQNLKDNGILDSVFYNASSMIVDSSSTKLLDNTKKRHEREKSKIEDSNKSQSEKDKMKSLIDRETKEFKQVLDLLIYQQKNNQDEFLLPAGSDFLDANSFNKHFDLDVKDIKKKNQNFKKRNRELYKNY